MAGNGRRPKGLACLAFAASPNICRLLFLDLPACPCHRSLSGSHTLLECCKVCSASHDCRQRQYNSNQDEPSSDSSGADNARPCLELSTRHTASRPWLAVCADICSRARQQFSNPYREKYRPAIRPAAGDAASRRTIQCATANASTGLRASRPAKCRLYHIRPQSGSSSLFRPADGDRPRSERHAARFQRAANRGL